jgi:hypothetical protein
VICCGLRKLNAPVSLRSHRSEQSVRWLDARCSFAGVDALAAALSMAAAARAARGRARYSSHKAIHGKMTAPTNNPNTSARNATAEAISTIPDTRFTDISVL